MKEIITEYLECILEIVTTTIFISAFAYVSNALLVSLI